MLLFAAGALTATLVIVLGMRLDTQAQASEKKRVLEIASIAAAQCGPQAPTAECVLCGKTGFVDNMLSLGMYVHAGIGGDRLAHYDCFNKLRTGDGCPLCTWSHKRFAAHVAEQEQQVAQGEVVRRAKKSRKKKAR